MGTLLIIFVLFWENTLSLPPHPNEYNALVFVSSPSQLRQTPSPPPFTSSQYLEKYYLNSIQSFETSGFKILSAPNPLTPTCDWLPISPYIIFLEANVKVKRVKEMITNLRNSWLSNRFSLNFPYHRKCKENSDLLLISPYTIFLEANLKVTRIKKMITNLKSSQS